MMPENSQRPRVAALTLGCKVNQYDTEAVLETFAAKGFTVVNPPEEAEAYLINTCTVTNIADKKSRQLIRKTVREHPDAVIAVFGCYAQTQAAQIQEIPGVALVIGTQRRAELADLVTEALAGKGKTNQQNLVAPLRGRVFEELVTSTFSGRVRAVLKIQEGCQQFCSYCKVPFARGAERSRELQAVLSTARLMIEQGYKEIVLTGIHLASYGKDLTPAVSLAEVTRRIAELPGLVRLRLSSVEPADVTPELLELIGRHPRVCAHLHLPLQSWSTTVLARMHRKYTAQEYLKLVDQARTVNPDIGITTDVIVGFPGETEAEFGETVAIVQEAAFSRLHVFPYSRRSGTPAAKLPGQIPSVVKSQRSQELIKIGHRLSLGFHRRLIGQVVFVLIEEVLAGVAEGYTENYIRVKASLQQTTPMHNNLIGSIWPVKVVTADTEGVSGVLVHKEVTS